MITTVKRNLQNLTPDTESSFDVITRTGYNGTFVGQYAGSTTRVTGLNNTATGYSSASTLNTGAYNTFIGAFAGSKTSVGDNNTYIGNQAGEKAVSVSENIFIGSKTAQLLGSANDSGYNVFLGNRIAFNTSYSKLSSNVLIGHDINTYNSDGYNNTIIGHGSVFKGDNIIGIGQNLKSFGSNNIILGDNSIDYGQNNFIVGKGVKNYGMNNVLIITDPKLKPFTNNDDNVININGVFKSKNGNAEFDVDSIRLGGFFDANTSNVNIYSKNISLSNDTNGIQINENQLFLYNNSNNVNYEITNEYQKINVGDNINSSFSLSNISINGYGNDIKIDSNGLIVSSSNDKSILLINDENTYIESENIAINSFYNSMQVDSNGIFLYSSNGNYISVEEEDINIALGDKVNAHFSTSNIVFKGYDNTLNIDSNGILASTNESILFESGSNVFGQFSTSNIILNGYDNTFKIDSNGILGSTNESIIFESGSNVFGQFSTSNIILRGFDNDLVIDSNGIYINGTTNLQDLHIMGDFSLCNWYPLSNYVESMLQGFVSIGESNSSLSNFIQNIFGIFMSNQTDALIVSKADFDECPALTDKIHLDTFMGSVSIENHLHVGGTLCAKYLNIESITVNGFTNEDSALEFNKDSIAMHNGDNTSIYLSDSNIAITAFSNQIYLDSNAVTFTGNTIFNSSITLGDKAQVSDYWWEQYLDYQSNVRADLVFQSKGGMMVTFNDDFYPEVLNFTGKHRCVLKNFNIKKSIKEYIGKIVIASGDYSNLYGENIIDIDEAIPVVSISNKENDKRVFGVVAGVDIEGCFRIGNIQFKNNNILPRVIIQSSGEGGIWVTNINGNFENGDLITTCIIPGLGAKQNNGVIMNYSICKITCDCDFKDKAITFKYKNKTYKKKFVGCVYLI